MSDQSALTFGDIVQWYESVSLLEDGQGNTFRIFLKSRKRQVLQEYMDYYQARGVPCVRVSVEALEKGADLTQLPRPADFAPSPLDPNDISAALSAGFGQVSINVSRLNIVTPAPYRLHYLIDPPLEADGFFDTEFQGVENAEVSCTVTNGGVVVILNELDRNRQTQERHRANVFAGAGAVVIPRTRFSFTGNWWVRVTNTQPMQSVFTLSFNRVVTTSGLALAPIN